MAKEKSATSAIDTSGLDQLDKDRPDLDRAYKVLKAKAPLYTNLWNYYDGDQPLMYTAGKMKTLFQDLDLAKFTENWCAVVIDAANDRINLSSVSLKDDSNDTILKDTWDDYELGLEASDIHEAALVIGESFMLVWPDDKEENALDAFYNDPRLVHLFYDPSNPRKKWYGAKWFVDAENKIRMTLYYPERLEYYISDKKADQVESVKSFQPYRPRDVEGEETAVNEYNQVPIFHFRTERRIVKGDLVNVIPLQNGINKLLTDMMVAAEYGAFKQRWIVSQADTEALKNAPNEIWRVPAGDGVGQETSVGEFDVTPLGNYISAIDHLASSAAIITRTPKHYLFQQSGTPSGEALIAMEAPLNKRCDDHIDKFIPVWKEVIEFIMKVLGDEVDKGDIEVNFEKPESIQPKTEAEIRKAGKDTGIPLKTLLREEGKTEAWMDQMEKDKKEEDAANSANLGVALADAIRKANQPEETPGKSPGTDQE